MTRWKYRAAWKQFFHCREGVAISPSDWGAVLDGFGGVVTLLDKEDDISFNKNEATKGPRGWKKGGVDVRRKSQEWIAGYASVVMIMARAAEYLHDTVIANTKHGLVYFPRITVRSTDNPFPKRLPGGTSGPDETECATAAPDPEMIYRRIIDGKGFTTRQKIKALHACTNWLEIRKDVGGAEKLYDQAIDLARNDADEKGTLTTNVIEANIQKASHLARTGRTRLALPMYISTLQTLRSAILSQPSPQPPELPEHTPTIFSRVFRPDSFPLPSLTGNEPCYPSLTLSTADTLLSLSISEILFSSPTQRSMALSWSFSSLQTLSSLLSSHHSLHSATDKKGDNVFMSFLKTTFPFLDRGNIAEQQAGLSPQTVTFIKDDKKATDAAEGIDFMDVTVGCEEGRARQVLRMGYFLERDMRIVEMDHVKSKKNKNMGGWWDKSKKLDEEIKDKEEGLQRLEDWKENMISSGIVSDWTFAERG